MHVWTLKASIGHTWHEHIMCHRFTLPFFWSLFVNVLWFRTSEMYCTRCYFGYLHPYLLYIWETLHIFVLMVWIHMYAHEYIYVFYKIWIFYVFFSQLVFYPVFCRFRSDSHFGLRRFDDRSGSDNIGLYMEYEANKLSLYFVDTKTQQLRTLAIAECEVEYMFTNKIDVNLLPTNQ